MLKTNLSDRDKACLKDLLPEEKEEILRQIDGLSPKEVRTTIRVFKLRLDCPELSEEQLKPLPIEYFLKVQELASELLYVVDDIDNLNFQELHPNAKAFLLSQVKKSIGILASVVNREVKNEQ
jgi:hypothetical protein